MAENNGDRPRSLPTLLILLGGLILVFAARWISHLVFLALPESWSRFGSSLDYGLEHLGVVVVVAMLVRGTIEKASQLEFISVVNDKVKKQIETSINTSISTVSETAIKPLERSINKLTEGLTYRITSLVDPSLQKMLKESVLNPAFIRPEYSLRLKLEPLDAQYPDLLKVFVGISYQVRNVTSKGAIYPIESWLDDVIQVAGMDETKRSHFTRVAYDDKKPLVGRSIEDLKQAGRIVRGDGMISVQTKKDVEPNSSLHVEIEGVQLMRTQDHFVWNLVTLTEKLEIVIELLGGLTSHNFAIFPREMHHIGHEEFQRRQRWEGNKLTMTIDQVLLPYQGIELRWSPRVSPAAQSTHATAVTSPSNPRDSNPHL